MAFFIVEKGDVIGFRLQSDSYVPAEGTLDSHIYS